MNSNRAEEPKRAEEPELDVRPAKKPMTEFYSEDLEYLESRLSPAFYAWLIGNGNVLLRLAMTAPKCCRVSLQDFTESMTQMLTIFTDPVTKRTHTMGDTDDILAIILDVFYALLNGRKLNIVTDSDRIEDVITMLEKVFMLEALPSNICVYENPISIPYEGDVYIIRPIEDIETIKWLENVKGTITIQGNEKTKDYNYSKSIKEFKFALKTLTCIHSIPSNETLAYIQMPNLAFTGMADWFEERHVKKWVVLPPAYMMNDEPVVLGFVPGLVSNMDGKGNNSKQLCNAYAIRLGRESLTSEEVFEMMDKPAFLEQTKEYADACNRTMKREPDDPKSVYLHRCLAVMAFVNSQLFHVNKASVDELKRPVQLTDEVNLIVPIPLPIPVWDLILGMIAKITVFQIQYDKELLSLIIENSGGVLQLN